MQTGLQSNPVLPTPHATIYGKQQKQCNASCSTPIIKCKKKQQFFPTFQSFNTLIDDSVFDKAISDIKKVDRQQNTLLQKVSVISPQLNVIIRKRTLKGDLAEFLYNSLWEPTLPTLF